MEKSFSKTCKTHKGFSLAEVLAALTISAMIMAAILGVYRQSELGANKVLRDLDESVLPSEVLQRIAEDLDRILAAGSDTKITVKNKQEKGFSSAQLKITKTFYDGDGKQQIFEEIIWQTGYDFQSDANNLVLYRSYSGIGVEDKLLDEEKEEKERGLFVPVCSGVTFFSVQVPDGNDFQDNWDDDKLPYGITVTLSFAEPYRTLIGTLDVFDEGKITRTMAVDRTRKIDFMLVSRFYEDEDTNDTASKTDEQNEKESEVKTDEKPKPEKFR